MNALHAALGIATVAANLGAAAVGAAAWALARSGHSRAFWILLRVGQALAVLTAADGLVLVIAGRDLPELHLVYGLTPLAVSFLAEQLRLASADSVLQSRDLEDAQAMRALPESEQRGIVRAILRREMGVMTVSALVVGVLAMRAGGWL